MKCRKCRTEIPNNSVYCSKCGVKQQITRRPKTRGNGTGTAYRLPNGTWIAQRQIKSYVDADGTFHRKVVSKSGFKTKKEAIEFLPMLLLQSPKEKTVTFRELYDLWEPTHRRDKSTMGCYQAAMSHFRPVWGESIREITIDDLQECMDDVPGKRTQENMKALCGLLYKYAIPRHLATLNMGPYLVVRGTAGIGKEGLPLAALDAIAEAVGTVPYADYVTANCYLGFRPGELMALDCSSYDRVNHAIVGGAKTDAGRDRTVTISPKIQDIIDRLAGDRTSGPLFIAPSGRAMSLSQYRDMFYEVLDACGIDNPIINVSGINRRTYTPHSCRHTFATLMKNIKAPDKDKLALIGHTSTEMLRHYQDVDLTGLRSITDQL